MSNRLAHRTAVVTGAGSGIGAASARLFAAEGARVLAVDVVEQGLEALRAEGIETLRADLGDPAAAVAVIAAAKQRLGGLDILFNNAGIARNGTVAQMADADWNDTLAINLSAPFRLTRAAAELLSASPSGRILMTASVMAVVSNFGLGAYSAAKAGLVGLTRTLAIEFGKAGVTANAILPGAIATGMTKPLWEDQPDIADIWAKKAALRRLGTPEDIARVALFLASDDAGFITGQAIAVDGGIMLRV
jgi:NAD(P)-dependent dehydrogenase (short-subunit alcohol dehydrogenase family)